MDLEPDYSSIPHIRRRVLSWVFGLIAIAMFCWVVADLCHQQLYPNVYRASRGFREP